MKTKPNLTSVGIALFLLFSGAPIIHAQGPLDPPGPPGDTMKTLQEIWDKIGELEAQNSAIMAQLNFIADLHGTGFVEMVSVGNGMNAARLPLLLVIVMLALATNGGGALNLGTMLRRGA